MNRFFERVAEFLEFHRHDLMFFAVFFVYGIGAACVALGLYWMDQWYFADMFLSMAAGFFGLPWIILVAAVLASWAVGLLDPSRRRLR